MDTKHIDEAESLIEKYRKIMAAKERISVIEGEDVMASRDSAFK